MEAPLIHEPWKLTQMEQELKGVKLGTDYPLPFLDLKISHKEARDRLYGLRKSPKIKKESLRILQKHTLEKRKP